MPCFSPLHLLPLLLLSSHAWSQGNACSSPAAVKSGVLTNASIGFGTDVSISGDWAFVGRSANFSGTVAFFERTGSGWVERTTAGIGRGVSIQGDRAVLGLSKGSTAAQVFERVGSTWNLVQTVVSPSVDNHDDYGRAVALDGDTYVVTAPDYGLGLGMVEVVDLVGGSWQVRYVMSTFNNPGIYGLGQDVDLDGRWVVTTATKPLIFDLGPTSFGMTILNPGADKVHAVAVSGDTVALGASSALGPAGAGLVGKVYLFDHDGSAWIRGPELQPAGLPAGARFGTRLELDQDRLIVGAGGSSDDAFFVFERVGEEWIEVGRHAEPGAGALGLGWAVSLDGSIALAGAFGEAHVFDLDLAFPPTPYCDAGTTASGCQARVIGTGTPSASASTGFTIDVTGSEGQRDGTLYFGTQSAQANAWGNGSSLQCVTPPVTRTGVLQGAGSFGACDGGFALDFNAWMTTHPGQAPGPGETVFAQAWFRDPQNTSNQSTSLSDALVFTVCP